MKLIVILTFLLLHLSSSKLIFVYELSRHGARSPSIVNNGVDLLGEPWAAAATLTVYGMQEHYQIGEGLRKKYIEQENFLSKDFNPNEIYTNSSSNERCQASSASQLIGLYPQEIYQNEHFENNPTLSHNLYEEIIKGDINALEKVVNLAYQNKNLFPINIMSESFEGLTKKDCAGDEALYEKKSKKRLRKELIANLINAYPNIQNVVTTIDFSKYKDNFDLCDAYICDYKFKLNLSFIDPNPAQFFNACTQFLTSYLFSEKYNDPEEYAARVNVSPIMSFVLNYINNIINNQSNPHYKLIIHMLHDHDIAALQVALNYLLGLNLQPQFIDFAYHFIFEIHQDDSNGEFSILILYNGVNIYNDLYSNFYNNFSQGLLSNSQINEFCESDYFLH